MNNVERVPLVRKENDRMLAGVCAGLAAHLNLPVTAVRWVTVGASLLGGLGVLGYAWFVFTVPTEKNAAPIGRLMPHLGGGKIDPDSKGPNPRQIISGVLAVGLFLLALGLILDRAGVLPDASWLLALVLAGAGLVIAWVQIADLDANAPRSRLFLRLGGGTALVVVGVVVFLANDRSFGQVVAAAVAGLAIVGGVGLVFAPLGLRLWRELVDTRAASARDAERADIAAHLHDSVLQTLALIRTRADDPAAVRQLARAQERELRQWLYTEPVAGDTDLAEQLRTVAASVEDRYQVAIDVVMAGDIPTGVVSGQALVAATGEALTNAAKHGSEPISMFCEFGDEAIEVFVRDRGQGFDMDQIADDRHGVRESMVARMQRHGGAVKIRSDRTRGTDVELFLPLDAPHS